MDIDAREVRRWREQGLSQQACAERLGLSRDQLRRRSKRDPALLEALRPGATLRRGDGGKAGAAHSRAQAAKRRAQTQALRQSARPPAYVDPELMAWRLSEYMYTIYTDKKPPTVSGMQRALGVTADTWGTYRDGSRDEQTYKIVVDGIPLQSREGDTSGTVSTYRGKPELYPYMHYICTGTALPEGAEYTRQIIDEMLAYQQLTFSDALKNALLILREDVESRLPRGTVGDIMRAKVILGWQDERTVTTRHELCTAEEAAAALETLGYKRLTS